MAHWFSTAFSPSPAHVSSCSFSKRTTQDALIANMGILPTIPLLQMIITLLALSECLPISTGGSTPGTKRPYQQTNVLPPALADKHARAVIKDMEKLWIQKFENSEYFKQLPQTFQEDVLEFLKSRTRTFLGEDQNLNSQEHTLKETIPRSPSDTYQSTESNESPNIPGDVKSEERDSKSNNVTVTILSKNNGHRAKRSFGRMRDFGNRISPYLSDGPIDITYTHVVPCVYADRYYCLNGGTCVFVGALDLKTCRCPMGYTGLRCEMIDQEYILSLLTNSIMFD